MKPDDRRSLASEFLMEEVRNFRRAVRWGERFHQESTRMLLAAQKAGRSAGEGHTEDAFRKAGDPQAFDDAPLRAEELQEALWHVQEIPEYAEHLNSIFFFLDNYLLDRPDDLLPVWLAYRRGKELPV